jgi:methyltransferase (TIGR00027 family)
MRGRSKLSDSMRSVSDTARLAAFERGRETERRKPLFRDHYARELAGERGRLLAREIRHGPLSWPVSVRTAVFDEMITRVVERDGADCVLNLAAGLDTRPYRLDLPAGLRWIEADLPDVLQHKASCLEGVEPRCQLERIAVDLTDPSARRRLLDQSATGRATLVVSEGLLVYLTRHAVSALGRDLALRRSLQWWVLDLAGPKFLAWSRRRWGRHLSASGISMRFAPEEGPEFFVSLGWRPSEVRHSWDEARRLGREPWLMGVLWSVGPRAWREVSRNTARYLLLTRQEPGSGAP